MITAVRRTILVVSWLLLCSVFANAQPGGNPGGGTKPGGVPISGIEILIAAGGLLGARKIFSMMRKEK